MKFMRPNRREILKTLGLSSVLAPFIPILDQEAHAQAATFPTRLVLVLSGNGSRPSAYWPTGAGDNYSFEPGSITAPLEAHKAKLIFPRGLMRVQTGPGGHESAMVPTWNCCSRINDGATFGGYASGPSVDQIVAQNIPDETPFRSLEFGVMSDGAGANTRLLSVMSYAGSEQPLRPESNPYNMYDRLMFDDGTDPGFVEELARARARRQSSIDLVKGELARLNPKIGARDRIKLEAHLEGLLQIEKRLDGDQDPTFVPPERPRSGIDLSANDSFPEILAIQNAIAVAALASNRTRVLSLMWGRSFSLVRHRWAGVEEEHHTLSHNSTGDDLDQKQAIETWFMGRMAELLTAMDAVQEGDGTLLDNTMLIYTNELADGAAHIASDSQLGAVSLVAGRAGGKLRSGRLLDLRDSYDWSNLLTTACQVMGATNIEQVGDRGTEGDIGELYA